jgi:hypothetical protein
MRNWLNFNTLNNANVNKERLLYLNVNVDFLSIIYLETIVYQL